MKDQLKDLGLTGTRSRKKAAAPVAAPKPARKQKAKPNPAKAAKKAKPVKDEQPISITLVDETAQTTEPAPKAATAEPTPAPARTDHGTQQPPVRELLLLRAENVLHCGVVGDLAIVGVLRADGSRSIRMRFDFSHRSSARFEIRILPVGERGHGWISSFHERKSATAIHLYDLNAVHVEPIQMAA